MHPYNAPIYQQIESVLIPWSLGKQSFNLWNLVQSSCRPISAITLFNTKFKVGKLSYWYFSSKSISKPLIWKIIWKCVYCQIILWQGSTSSGQWLFYYRVAKEEQNFTVLLKTNINCIEGQSGAKIISGLSHLFSTHCN